MEIAYPASSGPVPSAEDTDLYHDKVGGQPIWPSAVAPAVSDVDAVHQAASVPPPPTWLPCALCNAPLALVLQCTTPSSRPDYQRWLYLFGCNAVYCSSKPQSWRLVRCMRPVAATTAAATNATGSRTDVGATDAGGSGASVEVPRSLVDQLAMLSLGPSSTAGGAAASASASAATPKMTIKLKSRDEATMVPVTLPTPAPSPSPSPVPSTKVTLPAETPSVAAPPAATLTTTKLDRLEELLAARKQANKPTLTSLGRSSKSASTASLAASPLCLGGAAPTNSALRDAALLPLSSSDAPAAAAESEDAIATAEATAAATAAAAAAALDASRKAWFQAAVFPCHSLEFFASEETDSSTGPPPTASANPLVLSKAVAAAASSGNDKDWSGEVYEQGYPSTMSKVFRKFQKAMSADPEQAMRYHPFAYRAKATPLWFENPAPALAWLQRERAGVCPHCQAPRFFEAQLMPAMLQLLPTPPAAAAAAAAASASADGASVAALAINRATKGKGHAKDARNVGQLTSSLHRLMAGMNWGTVLLYTCSRDCLPSYHGGQHDASARSRGKGHARGMAAEAGVHYILEAAFPQSEPEFAI
ncbi:hypothetical protein CXG81DRAFT_26404 [Caulochytrium protostelioides]|uniref:Programmed cell death protein 2 C-terminal domain-containing protein n=1 Tax=Caulochytrium protostelioides TaxID=1555241 RepID=A0A4P9X6V2_9FUNG|nr:hypothetical protein CAUPRSCDRAFT_11054 [Caulochytrium protostelioides]RKP00915.1 hypothetical protein CXG81DRAFT_26404 [Caulochytrium protostelioides]|eukprot:RKP00915.1 hypothetical protein CXG81DRAFT_26404 [Caulochytrium protostelioides]